MPANGQPDRSRSDDHEIGMTWPSHRSWEGPRNRGVLMFTNRCSVTQVLAFDVKKKQVPPLDMLPSPDRCPLLTVTRALRASDDVAIRSNVFHRDTSSLSFVQRRRPTHQHTHPQLSFHVALASGRPAQRVRVRFVRPNAADRSSS